MKSFTTLYTAKTIVNPNTKEEVVILKVKKDGTKRTFFKPTVNGQAISTTLWARLCEAESLSKMYLNRNN